MPSAYRRFRLAFLAMVPALALAGAAATQELGDRVAGHELAMNICAECHWVSDEQMVIPESEAPSFFQIAETPGINSARLRVFFGTPHHNMPDIMLTAKERDDVIAYILGLRQK